MLQWEIPQSCISPPEHVKSSGDWRSISLTDYREIIRLNSMEFSMPFSIAVADNHSNIFSDSFGSKGGTGEAGCH